MSDQEARVEPEARGEADAARPAAHPSHLVTTSAEDDFYKFEFALHHITESFWRWSAVLHEFVSGDAIPSQDVSLLQTIRMNDRPKSAVEIGKFQNREDSSNILYALRKLEKTGLIRKSKGPSRQTTYQVTDRGREVTDRYALLRKQILLDAVGRSIGATDDIARLTEGMWNISGLYEQAARKIARMQMLQPPVERHRKPEPGGAAPKPRRAKSVPKTA